MPNYLLTYQTTKTVARRLILSCILLCLSLQAQGQIGYIFDPSTGTILDPNGDGYISASGGPIDTSVVPDESYDFEYPFIPMFHLSMEPPADLQGGNDCGKSEIVDNPTLPMHAGYWCLVDPDNVPGSGDEALIYRIRVAKNTTGAYGFSFLIDTDNKMGFSGTNADPNAISGNPGFEREVIFGTSGSGTISIVDVDGTTAGTTMSTYPGTSHSQRSHAGYTNCPLQNPVFIDFYIPFDSLGIGPNDSIRMIFATSTSPNSALGGSASDIGGVNDNLFNNIDSIFVAITDSTPSFTLTGCGWAITQIGQEVSCHGATDGWAWVDVWGGTPPISYLWSTGSTNDTVYNLGAGTYEIYITSGGGCTDTVLLDVTEPDSIYPGITIVDSIQCFGSFNGSIAATPTGGTPPYSIAWSNGAITDTVSNLGPGTYSYVLTDARGCSDSATIVLTEPTELEIILNNQGNILCYGDTSGSIGTSITGGTPPYTLLWDDGSTDSTRTNVSAGFYSLVVTDANGCTDSIEVEITQPALPLSGLAVQESAVNCYGGNDGVGVVVPAGGYSPYTFEWSNGETNDTAFALSAGNNFVIITDSVGCIDTVFLAITQPTDSIVLNAVVNNNVNCFGDADGSLTAQVSGGTLPYSFLWNTGATTASITGPAGTYTVYLTDGNGCTDSAVAIITQPSAPLSIAITDTANVLCYGDNSGLALATASGGTPPYDIQWSNGVIDSIITNLAPGTYSVVVTDSLGCQDSTSVTITAPAAPVNVTLTISNPLLCFGDADGEIYATITGGTGPYTQTWNTGSTNDTINGLAAGTYSITIADANGCIDTAEIVLTQPDIIDLSIQNDMNVQCFGGNDGGATVTATGGTAPYTYLWDSGQTTDVVTDLTAGTHQVVVSDANGCSDSISVVITQPATAVSITVNSQVAVTCKGDASGSITTSVSGGTPPYMYSWNTGSIQPNLTGLSGGTYVLTVTDAQGCQDTASIFIFEPSAPLLTSATDAGAISCNGGSDGVAYASASGGVPPYNFSWNNGMTGDTITGLTAGTYTVTVTDSMGCTVQSTVTVTEPPVLLLNGSFNNVVCFGGSDGSASVTPSGGVAPYSYLWSTGDTTSSISNLAAGTYSVDVTDSKNCTHTEIFNITEPAAALATVILKQDATCFNIPNGSAEVTGMGGVTPYTYLWDDGQTTSLATNLGAGWHFVTLTDANGCQSQDSVQIDQPLTAVNGTLTMISAPTCAGFANGEAYATATGGTPPYTFNWSTGSTNDTITGLGGGDVFVIISDANGCQFIDTINIPNPSATLAVNIAIDQSISCYGSTDAILYATASGGDAPYTYTWSTGLVNDTLSNVGIGTYVVTVIDSNGCSTSSSITLTQPDTISLSAITITNVNCMNGSDGTASVVASGGTSPFTYAWSDGQSGSLATGLSAGTYIVTVTDARGCQNDFNITISNPTNSISVSANMVSAVSCFGGSNGSATATASNGNGSYTYLWSDGQTTATAINLAAGVHTVIAQDSTGCTDTTTVTITQPASALTLNLISSSDVSCFGGNNGWASIAATGGTAPYTYGWTNGQNGDSAFSLSAGTLTAWVTDGNGCIDSLSVIIAQPTAPLAASGIQASMVSCFGGSDGIATVNITGGTAPYSYLWSNSSTNDSISGLAIGTYTVLVTDSLGCTTSASVTITQPTRVNGTITLRNQISCFGGSDGSAYVVPSGGTAPYTFNWSNGETNDTAFALTVGSNQVTITDSRGCTRTLSITITQPASAVDVTATALTQVLCFGDSSATARATGSGGTAPYTYLWSHGQTGRNASGLWAGTHRVYITDSKGCTDSATVTITQPISAVNASAIMTDSVGCFGGNNGTASASASGGVAPYTFSWSNGVTGTSTSGLSAGWYTVTVTDANGCQDTAMVQIMQPAAPVNASGIVIQQVTCRNGSDGSAYVSVTGGTSPYTYQWTNGNTNDTATGLPAGNYAVLVTDANGCQDLISITITQPTLRITINAIALSPTSCLGSPDGSAYVSITNGVAPFTYLWSNGETTDTATALPSGTAQITVTDALGCTATASVTIQSPPQNIILTPSVINNVNCTGGSDGTAYVFAQGGTPPYNYSWSNGQTTATATGLSVGTYTVIVTDFYSCMDSTSVTITENPIPVQVNGYELFPINCYGAADGWASATSTGGTAPYSYSWSNGQSGMTVSSLDTGWYVVTVTDAVGCTDIDSVYITQPDSAVLASIQVVQNVSCFGGSNAIIVANGHGGTAPYSFEWADGATTAMRSGLDTGRYNVVVTDVNGCQDSISVVITQPATAVTIQANIQSNVFCFGGNDGIATVTATGGVGGYTYLWSDGQSTDSAYGLIAGFYTITVTDSNGCSADTILEITQPLAPLSVALSDTTNINCFGDSTGSADALASGGTAPYSYTWSTGSTATSINNLLAGNYWVAVVDSAGCTDTLNFVITQPTSALTASTTLISNVNCFGGNDGSVYVTPGGGTAPYNVIWNTTDLTDTISGLTAGTYFVIVSDALGCSTSDTIVITQPTNAIALTDSVISNVNCFGGNDGSAMVTATGGTAPYTYAWSNGATTATISNLIAGSYSVIVTDANGCADSTAVVITQPASALSATTVSVQNVNCFGTATGSITTLIGGGTAPYSYAWNNGATTADLNNLPAGTYTLVVTDANGCTDTLIETITQPAAALAASANVVSNVNCFGGNDGSGYATISGGTAPYSILWNNGATTDTIANLTAGTYSFTVTDSLGCTISDSIVITQPTNAIALTDSVLSNVNCFGGNDGSAMVSATGGTAPYTYAWSNGATTATISNLIAGSYSVIVTDANGCADSTAVVITQPASALSATTVSVQNVNCFGTTTGSITTLIGGGTAPFSYAWNNGATTASISNLSAGTYTLIVTDANGCTDTLSETITQPAGALAASSNVVSNVNCFGGNDGSGYATISGGSAPYSILWNNGATTDSIVNLTAGTYSFTVTDSLGCTISDSIVITQPNNAIALTDSVLSNVNCFGGNDGSAMVTANGGTAPYTYAWSNGATTATISNLIAGSYSVIVTDANGCADSTSVVITQPASALSATTVSVQNVNCYGTATGSITTLIGGGTAPYSYAWNNGATTASISNLSAGTYTLIVTDANGCTDTLSETITQPAAALAASANVVSNVNCFGGNDGSGYATISGGTAPYSILWNNGATTDSIANLTAGTYSFTVTDSLGCTISDSIVITQPNNAIALTDSVLSNVNCFGGNDGSAMVIATGGTAPYTYAWSNGATTATISNLIAGTYSVIVTDANGCADSTSVVITQPASALSATTVSVQNVNCFGTATGSITTLIGGGTAPYSYAWNNGATTADLNNLPAGTYTLVVTDANGCTDTLIETITQPAAALAASANVVSNVNCFGGNDGSGNATISGGTAPYSILWNNGATTDSIANLTAGTYSFTVTDSLGCTISDSIVITQPTNAIALTDSVISNVNCFGGNDGSAMVLATGGTAPYTYAWSNGATTATISNLIAGSYSVIVTDANGCADSTAVVITQPASALSATTVSVQNVNCYGTATGSITTLIGGGTAPYSYAWNNGATTASISNLSAGTYTLIVTDANGCTDTLSETITQPAAVLAASANTTQNVSCHGGNNGSATANATGGTPPYTYLWSTGATTQSVSNLPAGSYTVIVNDSLGCSAQDTIVISEPNILAVSASVLAQISCYGANDGMAISSVIGGTAPYTYSWNTGATTTSLNNLGIGTFILTVTDASGCSDTAVVTITQPLMALNAAVGVMQNVQCYGGSDGMAYVQGVGGTGPYTYSWSNGTNNDTLNNVVAGTYTATILDANGCSIDVDVIIDEPTDSLYFQSGVISHVMCTGENDGIAYATPMGGTPPYTLTWNNGNTTDTIANLYAASYTATVVDAAGCSATTTVVVNEPPRPLAVTAKLGDPVYCYNESTGSAAVIVNGGTSPYTIQWTNGWTTDSLFNLPIGKYGVMVTDANGCSKTDSVIVTGPSSPVNATNNIVSINCNGDNSGSITVNPYGGTPPYFISWEHGTGATQDNLAIGYYNYTVTDAVGCTYYDSAYVGANQPLTTSIYFEEPTCPTSGDGILEMNSTGGVPPYKYFLNGQAINDTMSTLNAGDYTVTIVDAAGCDSTFELSIGSTEVPGYLHIPNAFTPNLDRINEEFMIYGSKCWGESLFQIFDRWGNMVFESKDPFNVFWDGLLPTGGPPKMDVYVWKFTSGDYIQRGHVVLVQ